LRGALPGVGLGVGGVGLGVGGVGLGLGLAPPPQESNFDFIAFPLLPTSPQLFPL